METKTIERTTVTERRIEAVDYDRLAGGAPCPCGEGNARVVKTEPWRDGVRVRLHRCDRCEARFKSVEEHLVAKPVAELTPAPSAHPGAWRANAQHPLRRG